MAVVTVGNVLRGNQSEHCGPRWKWAHFAVLRDSIVVAPCLLYTFIYRVTTKKGLLIDFWFFYIFLLGYFINKFIFRWYTKSFQIICIMYMYV